MKKPKFLNPEKREVSCREGNDELNWQRSNQECSDELLLLAEIFYEVIRIRIALEK